jgi:DNA primase
LPCPIAVLKKLGVKPGKANSAGYWSLRCPVHKGGFEAVPSLNMQQITGHYRCHACGIKGGDALEFYRHATNKGFVESAKDLGAWEVGHE